jgi:hypothetical protein
MTAHLVRKRARPVAIAVAVLIASLTFTGCLSSTFFSYDLPPERAKYTLTLDRENIHAAWEFWSSRVTTDETPAGYVCAEDFHELAGFGRHAPDVCRAEPLIFLRYDVDVGLDNAVPAGRSDEIRVTAYRQAEPGPRIAGLKLWVSTDDGGDWDLVRVRSRGRGVFEADVDYPRFSRTTGAVSLKAQAWDVEGNRVEETINRAFFLRDGAGDDDSDSDDDSDDD